MCYRLNKKLKAKRLPFGKEKVLFYQDNAQSPKSKVVMGKLHELRVQLIEHVPYSPDLGSSDFYLFPKL